MKTQGMRKRGFTLIELLVVVAIIVILAGITLPTLINAGAFQKEYVDQSGRTLYNMLRSAEFYAATYNVETCLAYAAQEQKDSRDLTGLPLVVVARSVGVFRRATDDELNRWESLYAGGPDEVVDEEKGIEPLVPAYVPVAEVELTEFQEGACVLGNWDTSVDPPEFAPFWERVSGYPANGLRPVRIRTDEGVLVDLVAPHVPYLYEFTDEYNVSHSVDNCWMAHVFSPAGYLVSDVSEERLVMNVGPTPSSDLDDRFIEPYPDPPAPLVPLDPITVQISKSSARIKIVE